MIIIKDYCCKTINFTSEYVSDIRTIRIISDSITDDSCCSRFQLNSFAWVSREDILLGVECVFPLIVESDTCVYLQDLNLEVYSFNMLTVETSYDEKKGILWMDQNDAGHYVLVLSDTEKANKKFCSKNLDFYVCNNRLVAIEVKGIKQI